MWEMAHPAGGRRWPTTRRSPAGRILPVYPLTEGLAAVAAPADRARGGGGLRRRCPTKSFPPRTSSATTSGRCARPCRRSISPATSESLDRARRRFVYQELFILQLALAMKRQQQQSLRRAPPLEATAKIDARIRRLFPFELTAGQQQAIARDRRRHGPADAHEPPAPGRRGQRQDVVAVYAMLLAVAHGYQAVLMAPTEVLARQHALTLDRLLAASQVRRAQLTGGLPAKARDDAACAASPPARSTWWSAPRR